MSALKNLISLQANHQKPSNSFNHVLKLFGKRAAASIMHVEHYLNSYMPLSRSIRNVNNWRLPSSWAGKEGEEQFQCHKVLLRFRVKEKTWGRRKWYANAATVSMEGKISSEYFHRQHLSTPSNLKQVQRYWSMISNASICWGILLDKKKTFDILHAISGNTKIINLWVSMMLKKHLLRQGFRNKLFFLHSTLRTSKRNENGKQRYTHHHHKQNRNQLNKRKRRNYGRLGLKERRSSCQGFWKLKGNQ